MAKQKKEKATVIPIDQDKTGMDLNTTAPPCYWCGAPASEADHLIEHDRGGQTISPISCQHANHATVVAAQHTKTNATK